MACPPLVKEGWRVSLCVQLVQYRPGACLIYENFFLTRLTGFCSRHCCKGYQKTKQMTVYSPNFANHYLSEGIHSDELMPFNK